jgi:predicted O-linked N-acetylglucosamine transferase (SPINDLY family)
VIRDIDTKLQQALALHRSRRLDDAERLYREILAVAPRHFDALHMLGLVQYETGRHGDAVESIRAATALKPDFAPACVNLGLALQKLGKTEEALASFERALALRPDYAEAHYNRGNVLLDLKRLDDAVASFDRALSLEPGRAPALYNRGIALLDLGRFEAAVASFDRALSINPVYAKALYNRAIALQHLRRQEDVVASFARLLELAPDFPFVPGMLLHARMHCCDWAQFGPSVDALNGGVRARKKVAEPFGYLGVAHSAEDLRICAEVFTGERAPAAPAPLWNGETYGNARIRIGYVSGEFGYQATAVLIGELFELHDHSRFELFAIDNGLDDASAMRSRIAQAFDEVVNITRLGDREAAAAIRDRKIDLLINLNGYFGRERQGVFSHRPCPVQVSYLGFPGTLGAPYIDYVLADRWVIPPGHDACYTEQVVRLPDSYQVNDRKRAIAERTPTRAELGLPDAGFVFCCFNNNFKITPGVFDVWMRLLREVAGSVLWLLEGNAAAARNLRREAQRRGVASERLVFAPRTDLPEHLARHRQADLFLDTLPCNAHTTASDALWAGLPLLTCMGGTFAGRVAASLLHAAGLPELVAETLDDYAARALELARTPGELIGIRARLARNRTACPLFDTERFRRHIESAYITMWERCQCGEPPASFAVSPMD